MEEKNQMKKEYGENEIDLLELFGVLLKKVHLIILAGILLGLVAFVGTKLLITPMYTSTTKFYVLSKTNDAGTVTSSDLQAGTQLTKDYAELVKSRPVLEEVISVLNLDMEPGKLADKITVTTPTDTRVMSISVEDSDPKKAKDIADAVRQAVGIQIKEIMDVDSVKTVEDASLPKTPSSPNAMKNTALGAMLGIVLACAVIVILQLLDDTIKTPEDVERYLELNVLTSVPVFDRSKVNIKKNGLKGQKFKRFGRKTGYDQ